MSNTLAPLSLNNSSSSSESIDSITLSKIYERVSKSIYEACDGFYSNKKNNVNWVKQAHVFNPFYESNYVVTYFLAKYIKKKTRII